MKRLPKPDLKALESFARIENNPDFERVKDYLFITSVKHVVGNFMGRVQQDALGQDLMDKGVLQALDDLKDITANSLKWATNEKLLTKKRED